MFRINYECKTKVGEMLTPFLVEGTTVYCVGKSGKTIIRNVKDFDFAKQKEDNIIIVTPMIESSDELFDKETSAVVVPTPIDKIIKEESKPKIDTGLNNNDEYV